MKKQDIVNIKFILVYISKTLIFIILYLSLFSFLVKSQNRQGIDSLKVRGPKVIITPSADHRYTVNLKSGFTFEWSIINQGGLAEIRNPPFDNSVVFLNCNCLGKGIIFLIVKATLLDNPRVIARDTMIIKRSSCPALIGAFSSEKSSVCIANSANIFLNGVIGDSIIWQGSTNKNIGWVNLYKQKGVIEISSSSKISFKTEPLFKTAFFRVISKNDNCSDTSNVISVQVDSLPVGKIEEDSSYVVCAGKRSSLIIANIRRGIPIWRSPNGFGKFIIQANGSAYYQSDFRDESIGIVNVLVELRSGACPVENFSTSITIKRMPKARFTSTFTNICPGATSPPIALRIQEGVGKWLQPTNSRGYFLDYNDPNTQYVFTNEDKGKLIHFSWKASLNGCDSIFRKEINVFNAGVARIIQPTENRNFIACPFDTIFLRADTLRNKGSYNWKASHLVNANMGTFFLQVIPPNPINRYVLTFSDIKTGCTTTDTLDIELQKINPILPEQKFNICPLDTLVLFFPEFDLETGLHLNVSRYLTHIQGNKIKFSSDKSDSVFKYLIKGRSIENKCWVSKTIQIKVLPVTIPIIVDNNNRAPSSYCLGYPNILRLANGNQCDQILWFNARKNRVLNSGLITTSHPYYVPGTEIGLEKLKYSENEPYYYCAACINLSAGCKFLQEVSFRILDTPKPDFYLPSTVFPYAQREIRFQNLSQNADNFSWDFGDIKSGINNNSQEISPYHFFSTSGTFNVTLVANNGACSKSIVRSIQILPEQSYFPNSFTPNGDNLNDLFRPIPAFWDNTSPNANAELLNVNVQELIIFDLNGKVVFKINDSSEWKEKKGWNGYKDDGGLAEPGTYLYKVKILQEPTGLVTHTGYLNLIR